MALVTNSLRWKISGYVTMADIVKYMSNAPTVSILIPVFNEEKTVRSVIDSVLAQDYKKMLLDSPEIIVVDDIDCSKQQLGRRVKRL